jgi:hypothetical protein
VSLLGHRKDKGVDMNRKQRRILKSKKRVGLIIRQETLQFTKVGADE